MTVENATPVTMTTEELCGLVFEAAGAATGPLLEDHPDYVFPSERVSERVALVLLEHGIDVRQVVGYQNALDRITITP